MFVMIGDGKNKKSMAYVENVAAFIQYTLSFNPEHTYITTLINQISI